MSVINAWVAKILLQTLQPMNCKYQKKGKNGPTSNVGVSNVGVFKRRSHQTSESQTSECSNAGVGQTSECSNVGVIIA